MPKQSTEDRFIEAYDQYADDIFRHCYFRLGDREQAKELMQDAFMKTWEYLAAGKKVKNLRAFLYRTAHHLLIDLLRRRSKREESSLEALQEAGFDLAGSDDADADVAQELSDQLVTTLIQKVKEPYRTALIMRHIDDLSVKDIASMLGVSVNVISVRVHRGMEQLRTLLARYA